MSPLTTFHAWILGVLIIFSTTNASFAQNRFGGGVGIRYGGSYYGGSFGYPGYSSGFGYRNYGYGPRGYGIGIYSNPGYYYSNPGYVTPQYSTPSYTYPNSAVIVGPNSSVAQPKFDNGPIVITNQVTNDTPANFTLNGVRFSINPGQSQKFTNDRDWIVEFDRGDGRGTAMYGLKTATYKFKLTTKGWELFEAANSQPSASPELANDPVTIRPKSADTIAPKPADDPTTVVPAKKVPKTPEGEAPKPAKADVQPQ